jgi:TetR/AcrR family transcriptional regulator of autoinduction and epiphytic fitness
VHERDAGQTAPAGCSPHAAPSLDWAWVQRLDSARSPRSSRPDRIVNFATNQFNWRRARLEWRAWPAFAFREQVLRVREDAIISSVNRLLADKGFDLMTVDEVAADVGIAKASLYKHFASKEALAAAAMVRLLQTALARVEELDSRADLTPLQRLQAVTRWLLEVQLAGEMPTLPSQNSSLRAELMASRPYMDALMQASDILGEWIVQAQADGQINPGTCRPRWCCTRCLPAPATRCRPF